MLCFVMLLSYDGYRGPMIEDMILVKIILKKSITNLLKLIFSSLLKDITDMGWETVPELRSCYWEGSTTSGLPVGTGNI